MGLPPTLDRPAIGPTAEQLAEWEQRDGRLFKPDRLQLPGEMRGVPDEQWRQLAAPLSELNTRR